MALPTPGAIPVAEYRLPSSPSFVFLIYSDGTLVLADPTTSAQDTILGHMSGGGLLLQNGAQLAAANNVLVGATAALGDGGVGEIQLANAATVPAANPTNGVAIYSQGGVLTYRNPQGLVNTIVGSQGGLTAAPAAITGTTSETVLQQMSLPANDAIAGAVYKMVGWGVFTTTGTPGNTVFTSRLGGVAGTVLMQSANIALTASLTNAQFNYEARINFLTSTTVSCDLEMTINTAVAGAASEYLVASTSAVTVSLTTTKAWTLDITPGASGNSIQLLGGWSERVA